MFVSTLKRFPSLSPLVWLLCSNLATLLVGMPKAGLNQLQSDLLGLKCAEALIDALNANLYDPLIAEVVCKLIFCLISCGPKGRRQKTELAKCRAADALHKVTSVHGGSEAVVHWATAAREAVTKKTNPKDDD
jgi:hypothetical protein